MSKTKSAAARGMTATRGGAGRKLLTQKALAFAIIDQPGETLEASFPPVAGEAQPGDAASAEQPTGDPIAQASDASALPSWLEPAAASAADPKSWSEQDERDFQAMTARRKASGFQRRGRDVGGQMLRAGDIAPNPGTVAATIVALVGPLGIVARGTLLDTMASATFPHPKARPQDRGWCQGYVAGLVRDGFLAVVPDSSPGENVADLPL